MSLNLLSTGGGTFALEHPGDAACGIPDEDTIVMIGGYDHTYVTRWLHATSLEGLLEAMRSLPFICDLNQIQNPL